MADFKASQAADEYEDMPARERQHSVNLNANVEAKIQNPLAHMTRAELLADVDDFARRHELTDAADMLRKGALVAQHPANFEALDELTDDEKYHLRREVTHKWRHPTLLYVTIMICSIGAAVQGWDQTGSNGANLSFPLEFGIGCGGYTPEDPEYATLGCNPSRVDRDNWLVGLVNSGPYIGAALIGCWLSDPFNTWIGRRGTIFLSGIIVLLTPIGGACAQSWGGLLASRLVLGIGMGLKGATVPIFAAENAPASIRGALVMSWQLWTAAGILLGFSANLAVKDVGAIAWRLQIGSAFIPAVPLVVGIYFCPESPRWYIKKGLMTKAYTSLLKLRNCELQAARDLYYINAQVQLEKQVVGKSNYITRWIQLFTIPRVRRATLAAFTVMIAQQMCGINIIAFYSSSVFAEAGASSTNALLASWGFGAVNFVFAWPAIWTIDTFGRRALLLFTFPNMAWTLLAAGLCFLIPQSSSAHLGLVALFIYLFAAFYSPGEGPVPFAYSAEVFPLSHREVGMGFAVATCLFWASVLSISFPRILSAFTPTGAFGFYAGLNIIAFCMIFLFVPETKQRTLEELDYIFAVPSRRFISYQFGNTLPYFFKRHVLFRKNTRLAPLYHFDEGIEPGVHDINNKAAGAGYVDEKTL